MDAILSDRGAEERLTMIFIEWSAAHLETRGILLLDLLTTSLLCFEVLVQKVKRLLVRSGTTGDGEHTLASLIMRSLGDRDAGTRVLADVTDLSATAADDASNHVRGDADVLSLDLVTVLINSRWWRSGRHVGCRTAVVLPRGRCIREVGTVASTLERPRSTAHTASAAAVGERTSTCLDANSRVVEDSTVATLSIVNQALADLPDGLLDAFGCALDFDDTLGGLGKHLLLSDHADTRVVLNLLDLETLATDDRTHLVVRDEEADSYALSVFCSLTAR